MSSHFALATVGSEHWGGMPWVARFSPTPILSMANTRPSRDRRSSSRATGSLRWERARSLIWPPGTASSTWAGGRSMPGMITCHFHATYKDLGSVPAPYGLERPPAYQSRAGRQATGIGPAIRVHGRHQRRRPLRHRPVHQEGHFRRTHSRSPFHGRQSGCQHHGSRQRQLSLVLRDGGARQA